MYAIRVLSKHLIAVKIYILCTAEQQKLKSANNLMSIILFFVLPRKERYLHNENITH
jgi:hypothetical protein